jgi:adenylosuccinate synthase
MLDIDGGTYPFVTSSNTGANGIAAGASFPARAIERVIGIAKAYCTRVGEGPFPTEQDNPTGERIRKQGNEYGSTTGRPRRCGWFDAVAVRYALELSGADGWIVTNLDVLSGFESIQVATRYKIGGAERADWPSDLPRLDGITPVYQQFPGWSEDITAVRKYAQLPAAARAYVEALEREVGAPILMLSVGPEREQVIDRGL